MWALQKATQGDCLDRPDSEAAHTPGEEPEEESADGRGSVELQHLPLQQQQQPSAEAHLVPSIDY
jgi:protein tyrosine phosphatase (PTP) superfamily phosphohydrolase (DUF442 family)